MQVAAGGTLYKVNQACRLTGCQLGKLHHPSCIAASCRKDWCITSSSCSICNKQRSISSQHRCDCDCIFCAWITTAACMFTCDCYVVMWWWYWCDIITQITDAAMLSAPWSQKWVTFVTLWWITACFDICFFFLAGTLLRAAGLYFVGDEYRLYDHVY